MKTSQTPTPSVGGPEALLLPSLRDFHARWLAEVRRHLAPARSPDSMPWERWAAVRYLETDFLLAFRRELDILRSLGEDAMPRIDVPEEAAAVEELRLKLDDLARTPGTAEESAAIANQFYHTLCAWCEEVEARFGGVRVSVMSPRSGALLGALGALRR